MFEVVKLGCILVLETSDLINGLQLIIYTEVESLYFLDNDMCICAFIK